MNRFLFSLLSAGALATIAFDLYGQGISPLIGQARLAPVGLANSVLNTVFGASPKGAAHMMHLITGLVGYPLGYWFVARPIARKVLPKIHWSLIALAYGVGLWIFALYLVAHLIAGLPAFLNFTGITWVSLWGHILFAAVTAFVMEREIKQTQPAMAMA